MLMLTKTKTTPAKTAGKPVGKRAGKIAGALTGLYDNVLTGWALNPQDPEQRLVIEIYVDGACVGVVRADQEQPADAEGDGFHGFSFDIKGSWLGGAKQISARIANQGPWLAPVITLPATTPSTQLPPQASSVQSNGLCLKGWAYDPANPGTSVPLAPNNEGVSSSAAANGGPPGSDDTNYLHSNPYPFTAAPGQPKACMAGNETYEIGKQVIGNPPGQNPGTDMPSTAIPGAK